MPVLLTIDVPNISSIIQNYNVIRVERSPDAVLGPFIETTHSSASSAVLVGSATGASFNVSGMTLAISVDDASAITTTFTGTNPLSLATLVSQINTAMGITVASVASNALQLTSTTVGTGSSVQIIGGSSLSVLGFTANQVDFGEDIYIPLAANQTLYTYTDLAGGVAHYYRTRFFSTTATSNAASSYSVPFQGEAITQLAASNLSTCSVTILDLQGRPVKGQRIDFYSKTPSLVVSSSSVGLGDQATSIVTDGSGTASLDLVVGQTLRVVFVGTSFVREFVVPASNFDLMTVLNNVSDLFDVQQPIIPSAVRRSL